MNSVAQYLWNARYRKGSSPAIRSLATHDLSYREMAEKAEHLASSMVSKLGLEAGDRVGLAMTNHREYFPILFGAWAAGLCVAPMNPRLHPREFEGLMNDCDAQTCFATPDIAEKLNSDRKVIDCTSLEYEALCQPGPAVEPTSVSADSPAWLFYTSGTTGTPKGATLTHRNLCAMVDSFLVDSGAAREEAMLHLAPLSHAGGLLGLAFIKEGLPQFIPPTNVLEPAILEECLSTVGSASFFAVPTVLNQLSSLESYPNRLHRHIHKIMFGGAPMYKEDLRNAIQVFGPERLWGGYGQGEAPCTISHLPSALLAASGRDDFDELLGSVGIARSGVSIKIVDQDDKEVEPGVVGEVVVKGDVVMDGYWNRPEATAETLRSGWLHTGDLGRVGESGLLTLVDRSKDMIISGGSNIYPREIEEVLIAHPDVREAAVIGMPDQKWGEIVVAFVVGDSHETALDAWCLEHMARFKRPKLYKFVKELPKSSYGKILKSSLRDLLGQSH